MYDQHESDQTGFIITKLHKQSLYLQDIIMKSNEAIVESWEGNHFELELWGG